MEISNGRFQEFQSSGEPKAQSRLRLCAPRHAARMPHAHPPRPPACCHIDGALCRPLRRIDNPHTPTRPPTTNANRIIDNTGYDIRPKTQDSSAGASICILHHRLSCILTFLGYLATVHADGNRSLAATGDASWVKVVLVDAHHEPSPVHSFATQLHVAVHLLPIVATPPHEQLLRRTKAAVTRFRSTARLPLGQESERAVARLGAQVVPTRRGSLKRSRPESAEAVHRPVIVEQLRE
eukprot:scaffold479_cov119-Isochrysis_galbana.AAC.9